MPAQIQTMTCMEVWGGSDAADAFVALPGLDAWVYSRPYQEANAGGDVYYASSCATGRINRLLVADVSGHGEKVRTIAVQLRDLMRRYVNFLDQSKFVRTLNGQFVESSAAGIFATALVMTFFAPTRTLSIFNAGHPPPLIYRARTREWSLLDCAAENARATNVPLGIIDFDDCDQFDIPLDVNDLVLLYTDSLVEAKSPDGNMLESAGLIASATDVLDPAKPEMLIPGLLKRIDDRTQGGLAADDVTALLLRSNGAATRAPFVNTLTAPFKVLASLARAATGRGPISLPDFNLPNLGGALFSPFNRLWRRRARL